MSKKLLSTVKNYLLIIFILGFCLTSFLLYQEKTENREANQRNFELFLNHFYTDLERALYGLDVLINNDLNEEEYYYWVNRFEKYIARLNATVNISSFSVSEDLKRNHTFRILFSYEPSTILTEDEETYLKSLNEALTYVKDQMYSEETTQENPNLTVEEFNDIIKEGTKLYQELLDF